MLLLPLFIFIFVFVLPFSAFSLNQEGLLLQTFKNSLDDPDGFFSGSWDPRDDTPCLWRGVACNPSTASVVSLDLSNANLAGPLPAAALCRLRHLSSLSLYNNNINSTLPGSDLASCSSLSHLNLALNLLTGNIPPDLSLLPSLTYLDLSGNNFSGDVPPSFSAFKNLQVISLIDNLLDGPFPNFLGNVSTLRQLNLSFNPFKPTSLAPQLFSRLLSLEKLWLSSCSLLGDIPDSISNLRNLTNLDLSQNALTGSIPPSITGLTGIVQIELYDNHLSGDIPSTGWANLANLRYFDASMNRLTGTIPDQLTRLPLASFNLYENQLRGTLPPNIADSPNLYELKLFGNRLSGQLPGNLGLNSPLLLIDVSNNSFSGQIPPTLCSKGRLEELLMIHNSFSGQIPPALGQCHTLRRVRFRNNNLSGNVPDLFWALPHVSLLELVDNSLSGGISKSIASAMNLSMLVISRNQFDGQIPEEIGFLTNLVGFIGSNNRFSGSLPSSITNLAHLGQLDLHTNQLSGQLPAGLKSWKKLYELNLADNAFSGQIPSDIGTLSVLNYLDLSGNQLSGRVPNELQNLKLDLLNLSSNRLTGPLPPLYAKESYKDSFSDNPGLCADISGLCGTADAGRKNNGYIWVLRSIFFLAALVFVVGLSWFYWRYRNFRREKRAIDKSKWTLMSFHKLGFSEYEIIGCLDEDNVIGSGASGKVYKAVLSNGEAVAVKKLWGPSNKKVVWEEEEEGTTDLEKVGGGNPVQDDWFEAEVETLGRIRHKNIVRLWCCCATRDCKLLVYEFMPNGSLGDFLHSSKSGLLDWPTRYKIALDAAEGLSYLHHDSVPRIVHRDVKSNNILLDADYGARVADFGLAKVVDVTGKGAKSMSVIAGSCGYIAPEYAYTLRVNEKSDIYSFGVVMLELVTGKRPVDPEYGEKDLVKWVCTILDQKGIDHVIDPKLDSCFKEEITKVLNIGLLCTSPLPINRPSMRRVVKMLQEVGGENQPKCGKSDGKFTPYYYEDASDNGSVS